MMAVDTSALMAILPIEPGPDACVAALEAEGDLPISAGAAAEALSVAARQNVGEEMERLIEGLGFEVVGVTPASARRIAQAYASWGKGCIRRRSISGTASPTKSPRGMRASCPI